VIVLDANLLIYAYSANSLEYDRAHKWVEEIFSGDEPIGLPWQTIAAFARVLTNPNLPGEHYSTREIVAFIEEWMQLPNIRLLSPGDRHWAILQKMILDGQVRGKMITDAQLAALTIEYGGVLYTADRDFSRFPGLRWVNPLVQA
jgi:uncharacterized protein